MAMAASETTSCGRHSDHGGLKCLRQRHHLTSPRVKGRKDGTAKLLILAPKFHLETSSSKAAARDHIREGETGKPDWNAKVVRKFTRPIIYEKRSRGGHRLRMLTKGMSQKNDAWYWVDHEVLSLSEELLFALPRTDWADWDGDSDLLFARDGKLFRLNRKQLF
jgi:hypothetical protein